MNRKIKKIFTNTRIVILLIFLVLAAVAINPNPWNKGVAIRSVVSNSSASLSGIESPMPTQPPMSREIITALNNVPVTNVKDYYDFVSELDVNRTIQIKTNKGFYKVTAREKTETITLNETVKKTIEEVVELNETINGTLTKVNKTITRIIEVPKTKTISLGVDIGIGVQEAALTNIRKGLDLQGGTRVLLQPERKITKSELEILIDNIKERLNVYGLGDIVVRSSGDLSGNQYILVEIAGANEEEVKDLLAKQGKFEAKIKNASVFKGGKDVTYVCRSADCAGIDPSQPCGTLEDGNWICRFRFSITLSPDAAERQAAATKDLEIVTENKQSYLSEKLILFLDDRNVDELNIGADLKGKAVTDIQISGSGVGLSQQDAVFNSLTNMKRLQTILITGSLPIKLNIMKTDNISPILGESNATPHRGVIVYFICC